MNSLAFRISPSVETNDHQVRVIIDGKDLLEGNALGIDPSMFFTQSELRAGGDMLVGRCECGCVGCDDVRVLVERKDSDVVWSVGRRGFYVFGGQDYDRAIEAAETDTSWEDINRTTERMVEAVFRGRAIDGGFLFEWASVRIRKNIVALSFTSGDEQKIFEIEWDGQNASTAIAASLAFKKEKIG